MTIFGALANRDRAVVWADSLITRAGKPGPHRPKLAVNALAGAIGTGCGWQLLAQEADAAVLAGSDLDTIVPAITDALRKASPRLVPKCHGHTRFSFAGNTYALVGWSASMERMVVFEFSAVDFFEPILGTECAVPAIDHEAIRLPELREVERLAALQARELRRTGHEVGRLTIATIGPDGIVVLPPRNISAPAVTAADPREGKPTCSSTDTLPCAAPPRTAVAPN